MQYKRILAILVSPQFVRHLLEHVQTFRKRPAFNTPENLQSKAKKDLHLSPKATKFNLYQLP